MTIRIDHPEPGLAKVSVGAGGRHLLYRCDPLRHVVTVWDEFGRQVRSFGGRGKTPGQFNTPLDITFVRPEFSGESLPAAGPDAVWLAVADYGNRRVQVLELDGAFVGAFNPDEDGRLGPPAALTWRAPLLEVEGVEGRRAPIHLSAALLTAGGRPTTASRPPREWLALREWVN